MEFVDALCPGLHLRVTIQGTRTFSAMFRVNGKLIRRTIGRYPRVSLSSARTSALDGKECLGARLRSAPRMFGMGEKRHWRNRAKRRLSSDQRRFVLFFESPLRR